jgi:putative YjhG/YagF family dehydratase
MHLESRNLKMSDILTDAALRNAMVVHAAFGGSTNVIIHLTAVAYHAGLTRPTAKDWNHINRQVPRLVDALPNGPKHHPTVQVFLAGGVAEVMLHLRDADLLELNALTASGDTLGEALAWWEQSERRQKLKTLLQERDGVNPDDVIMSPAEAGRRGMTSTVCFPHGNLAPQGSVIKSTAIDPSVVDADGVYRKTGPAKVFLTEPEAIAAIKNKQIEAGDILVLACRGPMGSGMEETYQLTSALKHLPFGKHVALITDARFSGVSTGACIGHVSPEALAGGPLGKVLDGDILEIIVDRNNLEGSVNLVGADGVHFGAAAGVRVLKARDPRPDLHADKDLPEDTRLWAALQDIGGGAWGGCVYETEKIIRVLEAGKKALAL